MEESITEPIDMSQPASGAGADTAAVRSEDGQATEDAPAQVSELRHQALLIELKNRCVCAVT